MPSFDDAIVPVLTFLMFFGTVVVQWLSSNREMRTRWLALLRVVIFVAAIVLCGASVKKSMDQGEENKRKDLQHEADKTLLTKLYARQGSESETLGFLELDHSNNIIVAREGVREFSKKLPALLDRGLAAAPDRQAREAYQSKQAEKLLNELRAQIEPMVDYFVTQFDAFIEAAMPGVESHGIGTQYFNKARLFPGAVFADYQYQTTQIRAASIGDVSLIIDQVPAKVHKNGDIDSAQVRLASDGGDMPLTLTITQLHAKLTTAKPLVSSEIVATLGNPAQEADLRKAIAGALEEIFTMAAVRAGERHRQK